MSLANTVGVGLICIYIQYNPPMRKILHVDADCFFAAIEMRDDPSLRGRPMAVGGSPGKRGVISTSNYAARVFGVRSAMASAYALRLCPELIIVPHNMSKYREVSQQLQRIFLSYTETLQPVSLDEAYLDVSRSQACQGSATLIAQAIRDRVERELGITVSVGVAPNKFLAKVASDWNKPDGLTIVYPHQVDEFVRAVPVQRVGGVGKVMARRLKELGVRNCADLQAYSQVELVQLLGSFGARLFDLCRGRDERPVALAGDRKSLSVEHTYEKDLPDLASCQECLNQLLDELDGRLSRKDRIETVAKLFVKIKFHDFATTTVETVATRPCLSHYRTLLGTAYARGNRPVRLLGLGVRFKAEKADQSGQLQLPFAEPPYTIAQQLTY